jgi:hypothetical protein
VAGERGGLPISVILSAANAHDATLVEAALDDIPAIRLPSGRRRRRPGKAHGDKPTIIAAAGPSGGGEGSHAAGPPPARLVTAAGSPPLDDRAARGLAGWLSAATDPL